MYNLYKGVYATELEPSEFSVGQNYSNPFKDSTKIKYCVANRTRVLITVFNSENREVEKLVDEIKDPGTYEVEFNTSFEGDGQIKKLPDGYYYYRMTADEFISEKKWFRINKLLRNNSMKTYINTLFFFLLITQICFGQGTWTKIGNMPEIRYSHTADEINGKVYIAGGISTEAGVWPTTMLVCDKADSSWTTIPLPDTLVRAWHTSCVVGNNLYLIGGVILQGTTWNSTNEVYMFNTYNGEWTQINPMPTDRCNLSCSLIDNKIYVVGGLHFINNVADYNGLKKIEVYDLATETWSTLPDMPTYRWGLSTVAYDNKIYVFGGRSLDNRPASIDVYDPQDSSWTSVTNIPTPRYQLATCVIDSNIYAIDGWYSSSYGPIYDNVEVYNPITDVWTTRTSMPVSVAMLDGYALDGKIYMYGGSYTTHPNIGISDIWEFTLSPVSVETEVTVPSGFKLEQNYPNPFNPSTTIKYSLPELSKVKLFIYNLLGEKVKTLIDEEKPAGSYNVEFTMQNLELSSGVYFYRLQAGDFVETKKMILLK